MAVVFWWVLCSHFKSSFLKLFSILLISLIFVSRIYLGVHSTDQVIGGVVFGIAIVYLWKACTNITQGWYQGQTASFWILLLLSSLLSEGLHFSTAYSPLGVIAIGSLLGYGLSLPYFERYTSTMSFTVKNTILVVTAIVCLILIAKYFLIFCSNELIFQTSLIVKYALLVLSVCVIFPYIFGLCSLAKVSKNI